MCWTTFCPIIYKPVGIYTRVKPSLNLLLASLVLRGLTYQLIRFGGRVDQEVLCISKSLTG